MKNNYDVIIIGAGIAGISSAINLKRLNNKLNILIIEKFTFPRNKLCAGYLTEKSKDLLFDLGLDITNINYSLIKGLKIKYKNKTKIQVENHGLYCQELVDRQILDHELFKLLQKEDITILEDTHIKELDAQRNEITLNNGKTYIYKNLIFADGELGYSSKFNNEKKKYFTMQMNFKCKGTPKIDMYFDIFKKGYAWCSRSNNYVNIGFCDIYNKNIDYISEFKKFVSNVSYSEYYNEKSIKGFFVPYGLKKNIIINNNIFLTGDSAGLVDPLTLAGISYAILSGKYVASAITNNNKKIYIKFLKKVNLKFKILKLMSYILYNKIFIKLFFGIFIKVFCKSFSYILDKFFLNKSSSFHE